MSTPIELPGVKRHRSGWPKSLVQNQMAYNNTSYVTSSSEDEETCTASESDSDSDDDCGHGECVFENSTLSKDHELQSLRPELLQSLHTKFRSWKATVQYVAPPDDRLPPRKRYRASSWETRLPESGKVDQPDESEHGFVIVSHSRGFFHLACPFHASDPSKYKECLLEHDLQSIEQVISHLGRCHMQPFYCPRCSETFDNVIGRDDHILERECEVLPVRNIEGINSEQRQNLMRHDKIYRGEAKRWERIWKTVFPNSELSCSPYLNKGYGLAISMARDYWSMHGHYCVSEFLGSRRATGDSDEDLKARHALCNLVLEDLLKLVFEDQGHGESS